MLKIIIIFFLSIIFAIILTFLFKIIRKLNLVNNIKKFTIIDNKKLIIFDKNNNTKYYNIKNKCYENIEPNNLFQKYYIFIDDFKKFEDVIEPLVHNFNLLNCDLLCPTLIDNNNDIIYFGGCCLKNKIFLFNNTYFPNLSYYNYEYCNKRTEVLFRNIFICKSKKILDDIFNNINDFQTTNFNCWVSPFVKVKYDKKDFLFDTILNCKENIQIENEVFVKNKLNIYNLVQKKKVFYLLIII